MERCQVYGAVGLVAGALLFLACGDGKSPVQPTPPHPIAPTPQVFSLSGSVRDTASRPLGGSRVEVIDGQGASMVTTTDEHGRFSMPGTFTGMITITASKDGYVPETIQLPRPPPPNRPFSPSETVWEVFILQPHGPSANVAGVYTLTLTADSACTNLPDEARTRTYTATIVPGYRSTLFHARLSDARFFSTNNTIDIEIAGDFANISVGIVERLGATTYLAIEGGAAASVGPSGITAPFNANFLHCPTEPAWSAGEYWWCGADVQGDECASSNNQLTLVRR